MKTHCKRGHEFTPENTRPIPRKGNPAAKPGRGCRACERWHSDCRRRARRAAELTDFPCELCAESFVSRVARGAHYNRAHGGRSDLDRFWDSVAKTDDCWIWSTGRHRGVFKPSGGRTTMPYRWIYEQTVGPIPAGYDVDHLCVNKLCVRPSHLEAVTHQENVRRYSAWRRQVTGGQYL